MMRRRACESLAAFRMANEHRNFGWLNYVSPEDAHRVRVLNN
jgi:hypothetical protein